MVRHARRIVQTLDSFFVATDFLDVAQHCEFVLYPTFELSW